MLSALTCTLIEKIENSLFWLLGIEGIRTWERGRENGSFPVAGVAELPYYSDLSQRQGTEGSLRGSGSDRVSFPPLLDLKTLILYYRSALRQPCSH